MGVVSDGSAVFDRELEERDGEAVREQFDIVHRHIACIAPVEEGVDPLLQVERAVIRLQDVFDEMVSAEGNEIPMVDRVVESADDDGRLVLTW